MSILLAHPKAVKYGVNRRQFDREYVEWICAREKVRIKSTALFPGFYTVRRRRWPAIFLNDFKEAGEQLVILTHELGHHFLHTPETYFYQPGSHDKREREAETMAAYSLVPTALLLGKTIDDIHEEYGYPREFLWFRKELFEQFKI